MLRPLFSFEGRAGPGEWWAVTVAILALNLLGAILFALLAVQLLPAWAASPEYDGWMWALWFCRAGFCALTLWPYTAVTIRRAHDRGKSGLIDSLLVAVSVIIWLGFVWTPWPDLEMPVAWLQQGDFLPMLALVALFEWSGGWPGTAGPNAYGPEPKRYYQVAA